MKQLITLLLSILCIALMAQDQALVTPEKIQELNAYVDHFIENEQLIGSLSINESGKEVMYRSFGNPQNASQNNQVVQGTIGSITKMFTAVLFAQLEEAGKIDFDEKLSIYYPTIPNAENITLHHMMTHTSGLRDYIVKEDSLAYWLKDPVSTNEIIFEIIRQGISFSPGDSLDYSNSAYYLLGKILEKKQGKPFHQILEDNILKPLQLKQTFAIHPDSDISKVEKSYLKKKDKWKIIDEFYFPNAFSAGCLVSSATDLNRFITAVVAEELISEYTLQNMLPKKDKFFGHGIMKAPFYEHMGFGHGGDTYGTHSAMSYFPENELAISYIINGENYPTNDFAIGLLSIIYDKDYQLPEFNSFDVDEEIFTHYTGTYSCDLIPIDIKVFEEDGILMAQGDGQASFPLNPISETTFEYKVAGVFIEFHASENTMSFTQGEQEFEMIKTGLDEEVPYVVDNSLFPSYEGTYGSTQLPIDLKIFIDDDELKAQGDGQPEFILEAVDEHTFEFKQAGIKIVFSPEDNSIKMNQGGQTFKMSRQ